MMGSLHLEPQVMDQMLELCAAAVPLEACGLVGGKEGRGSSLHPVPNALKSRFRYKMKPRGQLEAMLAIGKQQEEILAIYHSHPQGPDHPSNTDLAEWTYPDALCIICSPEGGKWAARGFRMTRDAAEEIEIRVKAAA